jgi:formylglycine-generating enzyme required for sulfatase activity
MVFVKCAAGSYYIGSPKTEWGRGEDEVGGSVRFSEEFWIARTECTQAQWQAIMKTNPAEFQGPEMPVNNVSYMEAMEFCEAMNRKLKPSKGRFTLPTEAQWEWAARGGTASRRFKYSGGNDLKRVGWYLENAIWPEVRLISGRGTWPVGQKTANELGLHDMSGNVREWCQDLVYDEGTPARPNRGGCFVDSKGICTVAWREFSYYWSYRDKQIGLRLARNAGS